MIFSESWLREFVDPGMDTSTLVETLTMAGLEVDGVEPAAADFSGVVVGLVEEA
jgi:phenylalanyl-tRNA synthetase beta chain